MCNEKVRTVSLREKLYLTNPLVFLKRFIRYVAIKTFPKQDLLLLLIRGLRKKNWNYLRNRELSLEINFLLDWRNGNSVILGESTENNLT